MARTPPLISTHLTDGLARRLEQFKNKPKLQAYLTVYLTRVQEVENAFYQLLLERNIDDAVGAQLDILGRIVGIDREGLNDASFRLLIRVQILANISSGTISDVLDVFGLLDPANTFELTESAPASFSLVASLVFVAPLPTIKLTELLRRIRSAGVEAQLSYQTSVNAFRFSSTALLQPSDDEGFAVEWPIVVGSAGSWNSIAADAAHAFAVNMTTGAFIRSADQGVTWPTSGSVGGVFPLRAFKQRNNEFVAISTGGARWTDGPSAFANTSAALPGFSHNDFDWLPSNGRYFVVGDAGTVYFKVGTIGDGSAWTLEIAPVGGSNLLVAHVANGFAFAAGQGGKIVRSATASGFALVATLGFDITRMVSFGASVLALGASWPTIGLSLDSGATWALYPTGLAGTILDAKTGGDGKLYFLTSSGGNFFVEIVDPTFLDFGASRVQITGAAATTLWPLLTSMYVASGQRFAHFRDDGFFDPTVPKFPWVLGPATAQQNAATEVTGSFILIATSLGVLRVPVDQEQDYGGHFAGVALA